ncbi:MAG: hypothetical protein ACJ78Q_14090 [Chloroflexia bacterium]
MAENTARVLYVVRTWVFEEQPDKWNDWQAYNTGPQAARLRHDYNERYGITGKIKRKT